MTNASASLRTAFCLPLPLIKALATGRMVVSLSRGFLRGLNSQFALLPMNTGAVLESPETVQTLLWAKVEGCRIHKAPNTLDALAQLTIWDKDQLAQILQERPHFFLAYLRVYELPEPIEIRRDRLPSNPIDDFGTFINLPKAISVPLVNPVLDDVAFKERHQQLIHLTPPKYPKLLELQRQVEIWEGEGAIDLNQDLHTILGWKAQLSEPFPKSDQAWMQDIVAIGHSSDGHTFEKLVRQALLFLGFSNSLQNKKVSLDPDATGGAGGIDVYGDIPYTLIGECKASKNDKVPDGVAAQLIKLGCKYLEQEDFANCIKVLFVAGPLTKDANLTAKGNKMNVMRPETLQRLVELKAKHPGSIDLMALKPCLEASPYGEQSDDKINKFIDQVLGKLRFRAEIINAVKQFLSTPNVNSATAEMVWARCLENYPQTSSEEVVEAMIELSSPLAGYLGRKKGADGDRFYFLRDLIVE